MGDQKDSWPRAVTSIAPGKGAALSLCSVWGLPLAAKILGGLLSFKITREQWQLVLHRDELDSEREVISALPSSLESPSSSFIAFPSLKHLEFFDLEGWECWMPLTIREEEHVTVMSRLCSLTIGSCPKLTSLPHYILQNTSLKELDETLAKYGKFAAAVYIPHQLENKLTSIASIIKWSHQGHLKASLRLGQ
ncbi:hypothetical protein V6N12_029793 [Hibiscus sabdariffa]|uniref:Uncharacterized protein n=1 Tax=Hibiscus sabdariffa TaxID=183260 RepID=A0ABR2CX67_9ROSI